MNFRRHAPAYTTQRGVNQLMPRNQAFALECLTDNRGVKVLPIACHGHMRAVHAVLYVVLDAFRRWVLGNMALVNMILVNVVLHDFVKN